MESETEEWKETWRKEYLDAICAFANYEGGLMIIGKRDNGEIIGVSNPQKMLEEIPNSVRNALRFSPKVRTVTENGKILVHVMVEPQKRAVDYEGTYYTRSGSTTVSLTGRQLVDFLLEKEGIPWADLSDPKFCAC
jgi:ATP-dependent DNA helicase RecG